MASLSVITAFVVMACLGIGSVETDAQGPNVKNPWSVSFCWDGKDDAGVAIPAGMTVQVQVKVDGANQPLVTLPASSTVTGCTTGTGYKISGYSASKGTHTSVGALLTSDGPGVDSDPFGFAVVGRPPSKITNFTVQ
jgi:hypothetical protein